MVLLAFDYNKLISIYTKINPENEYRSLKLPETKVREHIRFGVR